MHVKAETDINNLVMIEPTTSKNNLLEQIIFTGTNTDAFSIHHSLFLAKTDRSKFRKPKEKILESDYIFVYKLE